MPTAPAPSITPAAAWQLLASGNTRFVAGTPRHPHQSQWRRQDTVAAQAPFATVLSCADSRVPPEIVFDRGLGDLFTIRTAGHILDSAVLGTIEYGVAVVGTPVLAVLGHEKCGCVAAGMAAAAGGDMPGGHIDHLVEGVFPSVEVCAETGTSCAGEVMEEHVRQTVGALLDRSPIVAEAVSRGSLAVVGLTYRLSDGSVSLLDWMGDIGRARAATRAEIQEINRQTEAAIAAQEDAADTAVVAVSPSVVEAEEIDEEDAASAAH